MRSSRAFVLQGGASLSAPQVGALRALTEAGIAPDLVIASSVGALNADGHILDGSSRRDALSATGRIHMLPTTTSPVTNPLDFRETRRLIADGYTLTHGRLANRTAVVA